LPFIFRLHRLFFGVSALTFRCKPPLGASSPFISAVSAFIFRCKLYIPFRTTFEQKTYAAFFLRTTFVASSKLAMRSLKRLFVASSKLLELRRFLRKVYYIMIMTKPLQEIENNKRTKFSMIALY
jgi:formyltetrahydrofolate hydrolase